MMEYNPYSLEGKNILITGASSGIGRATAIECSKLGAKVILIGRRKEQLEESLKDLDGDGHRIVICDLTEFDCIERLVIDLPILDGCVLNAGITKLIPIQFINKAEIDNIFNINVYSPMLLLKELIKKNKLKKNSSVVFTSSIAGVFHISNGNSLYSSSKAAISAFSKTAALEFANRLIRVNCVNPGMVDTPLINLGTLTEEDKKNNMKAYALKRYGQPREIALAIVFLLSDASSWITGINLVVDGGRLLN